MSFLKTKGFKYFKNFVIGVGASVILFGARQNSELGRRRLLVDDWYAHRSRILLVSWFDL